MERRQATVLAADEANVEHALDDMAARTALHSIETLTLSDTQFLRGDANGKATTTSGQLRLAKGSGRLPVVVLQHGSAGMAPNVEMQARGFNRIGVSTFALDGFTGRGLTEVNTNQALLGRLNFIVDIYRALDVLAKHPSIDPARIALMGFSRGGQATLYASLKRFHYIITVMRSDRAKYTINSSTEGTAEENKATAQGTITYFGTYSVSEAERAIAIHIDGSSFPNWNGADQKRNVAITGDQLKLSAPIVVGIAEVVWERAQ